MINQEAEGRRKAPASKPKGSSPTRDRLIATAARLFHEQGYVATGVSTILREAEVHSGSLYHFFASKEDLLAAVLDWYAGQLEPAILDRARRAASDPIERVFALLDLYRQGLEITHCSLGCPIGNLALEIGDGHTELRRGISRNFQGWSGAVARWLREGKERFPARTDFDALGRFVLIVMEGGLMQARAQMSVAPFDAAVLSLRDYFDRLQAGRDRARPKQKGRIPGSKPNGRRSR